MSSAATQQIETFIKQYLISRNYIYTLKEFDKEIKNDKTRGRLQPYKLVETLHNSVLQGDLQTLTNTWNNLEQCFFANLDQERRRVGMHLKHALFKYYLVETIKSKRQDKTNEFYETEFIHLQPENPQMWKEWLTLAYIKNPQEHRLFGLYFHRSWVDTLLLSLHNYLSLVLSSSVAPVLYQYNALRLHADLLDTELRQLKQHLHKELSSVNETSPSTTTATATATTAIENVNLMTSMESELQHQRKKRTTIVGLCPHPRWVRQLDPVELMTDFGDLCGNETILRHSSSPSQPTHLNPSTPSKTSSGLISQVRRHFSTNAPPLFKKNPRSRTVADSTSSRSHSPVPPNNVGGAECGGNSTDATTTLDDFQTRRAPAVSDGDLKSRMDDLVVIMRPTSPAIDDVSLLSEDESNMLMPFRRESSILIDLMDTTECLVNNRPRHSASLCQVRFSRRSPNMLGTLDCSGQLNFWQMGQPMTFLSSLNTQSQIISTFDWLGRSNKMCLVGTKRGVIQLYAMEEQATSQETIVDKNQRIHLLESFPSGERFLCASRGFKRTYSSSIAEADGSLSIWNSLTLTQEIKLMTSRPNPSNGGGGESPVNSCLLNPSEDLVYTGAQDGWIRLYDLRDHRASLPVLSWMAYSQGDPSPECLTLAKLDPPSYLLSVGSGISGVRHWDIRSHPQDLCEPRCIDLLCDAAIGGPFDWSPSFKQTLHRPKGWLIKSKCPENYVLLCDGHNARVFDLSNVPEATPCLSVRYHQSPVVCLDWVWGEDTITCVTGAMDGTVAITYMLKSNNN